MKCLVVFGTRPEAIKLVPVVQHLRQLPGMAMRVCVTAQHREMLDQMLGQFGLQPDIDLNLMRRDQTLAEITAVILTELDAVLAREQPDLVFVQGDTTTTLTATLAAFYRQIPVAHVEAGLRTGNLQHPFPEEANRLLTSRLASLHFAPTDKARRQLLAEGVEDAVIRVTGNTGIDTLLNMVRHLESHPEELQSSFERFPVLRTPSPLVLITGHRRENFGKGLAAICDALIQLADTYPDYRWVYPVHLNPSVQALVRERLSGSDNIHLLPPLDYPVFVHLMQRCRFILTDSGGIQEEAPVLGKPVLVMRHTTERVEALATGSVKLVGTETKSIVTHAGELIDDPRRYREMARVSSPYGDGQASARIGEVVREWFGRRQVNGD